jgi:hypothetical protein
MGVREKQLDTSVTEWMDDEEGSRAREGKDMTKRTNPGTHFQTLM